MGIQTIVFSAASVCSGLILGQIAAGSQANRSRGKLLASAIAAAVIFAVFGNVTGVSLNSGIVYVLLIPFLIFFVKMPLLQAGFVLLAAWTYQLAVVDLVERNLFQLAIGQAGLQADRFIELVMELFILLNHLLAVMAAVRLKPVLIPAEVFRRASDGGEGASSYRNALGVSALLIVLMNLFLQYTVIERDFFSTAYRLFITGWAILMLAILLVFLKTFLEQKLTQEKFYLDQQYQQDLLSFFTVIRSQRHDFNFHLTSVYGLLKNKKYAEADAYIGEVVRQVQDVNELLPLAHPALSAMLNTQAEAAKRQDIAIHFSIFDDLRGIPVSVYDVNKILGNLIQNASEELTLLPPADRQLSVEISKEKRYYVIRVKNRTGAGDEQILHMFEPGFSTKGTHEGIGLAGVEKIVKAHYGMIYPELTDGWLTIHVRIPENTEDY
ncbi:hypothetical protein NCCP2716_06980 [Sporosarcina sp. NCCP-2716]|uniref:sensor histidine kinase n=1 Tax=Sporosarcina sp. NCCP-2716 TaxID=2943679 RepID=UPI0020421982|nr:GHKL domain-containing protein [Sporosarcina sp. NCCP-2716]GKV68200.1 hypothetical protein NCCP2716_06980 [Sporosarcina sp. NCCP-2716]